MSGKALAAGIPEKPAASAWRLTKVNRGATASPGRKLTPKQRLLPAGGNRLPSTRGCKE